MLSPQPSRTARATYWLEDHLTGIRIENLRDAWWDAQHDCDDQLAAWSAAPSGERRMRHAAYLAALDREAKAAAELEAGLAGG